MGHFVERGVPFGCRLNPARGVPCPHDRRRDSLIHIERAGRKLHSLRNPSAELLTLLEDTNPDATFTFVCYDCGYMRKAKSSLGIWTYSRQHKCGDEDAYVAQYELSNQSSIDKCITCDDFVNYCMCNGKKGKSV